ncbi:MAG: Wzz/FepE/Etk N-terminal domain-containing protein [Egibacteraceae bacterium]
MQGWDSDGGRGGGPGLLESLWRYRVRIMGVTVLAAVLGYYYSSLQPTQYRAVATLLLQDPNTPTVLGTTRRVEVEPYLTQQAEMVTSTSVLKRASQILEGSQPVGAIAKALDVKPSVDRGTVVVNATAPEPMAAAAIANAVGEAYQQVVSQRAADSAQQAIDKLEEAKADLQRELAASLAASPPDPKNSRPNPEQEALVEQLFGLRARASEIAIEAAVYGSGVKLFEIAREPRTPAQPKPGQAAALAAGFAALAAGACAWWAAGRNQLASNRDDPASVLGAPLLGEVPEYRVRQSAEGELIPSPSTLGPVATEAYHFVVASLEHLLTRLGGPSLVVTSVAPGDGKTSTALNIAIAANQGQRRVVLVDADGRTRRLSELCGRDVRPGLTDLANEAAPLEQHLYPLELADGSSVPVLPAGTPLEHPPAFFRSPVFRKALLRIGEQADLVLIDTPAILAVSDTIAMAGHADGVILVVRRGTPLEDLRSARDRLASVGTPLIGYVFNRSSVSLSPYAPQYNRAGGIKSRPRRLLRARGLRSFRTRDAGTG